MDLRQKTLLETNEQLPKSKRGLQTLFNSSNKPVDVVAERASIAAKQLRQLSNLSVPTILSSLAYFCISSIITRAMEAKSFDSLEPPLISTTEHIDVA